MGRRDYSTSPPRQGLYDDQRERPLRQARDIDRGRDYDGRYRGRDDGHLPRRDGDSRRSRSVAREERDYQCMHDDGYQGDDDPRYSRARFRDRENFPRGDDHENRRGGNGLAGYPPRARYARSRSRSRTRDAGKPSNTVILEGLPFGISLGTLREGLIGSSIAAEFPSIDVRVSSSRGYCRAFVQFKEVGHAVSFVKEHFPKLLITLPHSTDDLPDGKFDVYIHYARSQGDSDAVQGPPSAPSGDWACTMCGFINFATRSKCKKCSCLPSATGWSLGRTGAADAGREVDKKVQILVVFPLPQDMNEDMLANEMKRLELVKTDKPKAEAPKLRSTAPSADGAGYGARPGSLHRVFLMRDVQTGDNFEYGFAEFWTLNDALAGLKKFQMTRSFEIAGTPVTIASIHLGVFIPEDREVTPEIEAMSFRPLLNPSLRVRYRDLQLYPSQKIVSPNPPVDDDAAKVAREDKVDAQKPKKRKADDSLAESASKKAPVMAAQMAFWQRRHEEIRGSGEKEGQLQEAAASGPTRTAPIKFSLSGAAKPGAPANKPPAPSTEPEPEDQQAVQSMEVSYVDRDRLMCLICMMRYKSVDEVNIHEKSGNHKRAMEDEEKVKAALPRIAARDKRLEKSDAGQYRDRAKERREAHNQPNKPSGKPSKPKADAKPPAKEESRKPAESKGAGILTKMGWTMGTGLGAQGEGLTEALTASAYKDGVGLGADGGKLGDATEVAESRTKDSYASYLTAAQAKARERYNQME